MRRNNGFTLVELIVVMAIFIVILIIASYAFEHILSKGGQQVKSVESNTEGLIGFEMLRNDLDHAGFGLPWIIPNPPVGQPYEEVTINLCSGIQSTAFNEPTLLSGNAPSAVMVGQTAGGKIIDGTGNTNPGVAYLVIKSTVVAYDTQKNPSARKWAYVNYSTDQAGTNLSYVKMWGTADDLGATSGVGDTVITLSTTFTPEGVPSKVLVMQDNQHYSYAVPSSPSLPFQPDPLTYRPGDASQLYVVYGVDHETALSMPYNRADYYLKRPDNSDPVQLQSSCNPGTGILFKAVAGQHGNYTAADGMKLIYPLLSCVGDMQVGFELDPNNDGNTGYSNTLAGMSAADIRTKLKTARIYILAHEGKKDRNYTYSPIDATNALFVGPYIGGQPSNVEGRMWTQAAMAATFGADWRNYRWKVFTLSVQLKNLD